MHSEFGEEPPSDGSKYEIKNPKKIDKRQNQLPLSDLIGKREQRKEELEKMEGDLRQRLDVLECSMPAVMVWNIWRMSQGAPVCKMKRILEKQFKDTRELSCRSTPSSHYDCRVREVEAERKLALKKVEDARTLWSEKLAILEERKKQLEEAKRIQEEQKNTMEQLTEEAKVLRETTEKPITNEPCTYECCVSECKQRCLHKVSSVTSIESGDIQHLEKLQQLAEEEMIIKRDITELERREDAYMRTLQQADELWSKMDDGDAISDERTSALQEQLNMKTAANQQLADRVVELEDALEKCRTRMAACTAELQKFLSIEKIEATIGRDDDIAKVTDKGVIVRAKVVHRPIGRVDDVATVKENEVLAKVEIADVETVAKVEIVDEEALAKVEVADEEALAQIPLIDVDAEAVFVGDDKDVLVKPDVTDLAVDLPIDLVQIEDAESLVRPEDFAEEQKFKEVQEYLDKLGSIEELYKDGEPCAPDFVCNDVVSSPTGMTDEELAALDVELPAPTKKPDVKLVVNEVEQEKQFQEGLAKEAVDAIDDIEKEKEKIDEIPVRLERKVIEKAEKRDAEVIEKAEEQDTEVLDAPVKEILSRQVIQEETVDDTTVTVPDDVRTPEVRKIETKLIEKNEIKVKFEVEIKKEVIKEDIKLISEVLIESPKSDSIAKLQIEPEILPEIITQTTITKEIAERAEELSTEKEIIIDTDLMVPKDKEIEPVIKTEPIPFPQPEETLPEAKIAIEPVAELKLLPSLTKEEVLAEIESPTAVSIEDSFQFPTIPIKEDLKNDAVPLNETLPHKTEIEEIKTEETPAKEIEKMETVEMLSVSKEIEEDKLAEDAVEKLNEIPQLDKIKVAAIEDETIPRAEIIETKEIAPPVAEIKEIEQQADAEEAISIVNAKEVKEIMPEILPPTVSTEIEKPSELPIVDIGEVPIVDVIEEKIEPEEPLVLNAIKERIVEKEESIPITDVIHEKIEEEEPSLIADKVIEDIIKKEEDEIIQPVLEDIIKKEEEDEIIQPVLEDIIKKEEEDEIVQPVLEDIIKKEEEDEIVQPVLEDIIKKKEDDEIIQPVLEDLIKEEDDDEIVQPVLEDIIKKEEEDEIIQPVLEDIIKKEEEDEVIQPVLEDIITEEEKDEIIQPVLEDIIKKVEDEIIQPVLEDTITEEKKDEIIQSVLEDIIKKVEDEIIQPVLEDTITEEKDETIQLVTELLEKEIEKIEIAEVLETEIKEIDEEIEEMPEKITISTELFEEKKEEEIRLVKKEEILAEVVLEPKLEYEREEVSLMEKFEIIKTKEKVSIAERKPIKEDTLAMPIRPELMAEPYLIKKIKKEEPLQAIPTTKTHRLEYSMRPPVETAEPAVITRTEIVQTEIVQTEVIQITTQTVSNTELLPRTSSIGIISKYLKATELKALSSEIAGDHSGTTGRKMLLHKRLKDQSTITTSTVRNGSQTDKTSRVSHDRAVRDERERARMPTNELLRSIKIAAGLTQRPDPEREIRTIHYGGRSDEMDRVACNCCLCGKTPFPSLAKPRLEVQPQIDVKTATPSAAAAFRRAFTPLKIDRPLPYDRLCHDCKTKIQGKPSSREKRDVSHIEKIIKKISRDQESCGCPLSTDKSCRAVLRKRTIEKRDQACLAKISKRKTNVVEQKRKDDLQSILESSEKLDVKPLSPSCICFKVARTGTEPIKKGNCFCAN